MAGSGDNLEEWIIRDDLKQERRSRIVSPSSERLVAENPGEGEAAFTAVAAWLGTQDRLPIVELATLSQRAVTLVFAAPVELPEPWIAEARGTDRPRDQWGITLQHAMSLGAGDDFGWQVAGVTGMGTLVDGSRGLINTSRWGILGVAGTPEWTRHLMITQVMNQAAEPWSSEQDIWLVGYESVAERLIAFLAPYHPHYRFHAVDSLEQIRASDLEGAKATIYVMGADSRTEAQYNALGAPHVGLIADQIISDQSMFITERPGGGAVLGPFATNLDIYPNISSELINAMDMAWEANERMAAEKAAAADFSVLLSEPTPASPMDDRSDAEIAADFAAMVTTFDAPTNRNDDLDELRTSDADATAMAQTQSSMTLPEVGDAGSSMGEVRKSEGIDMLGSGVETAKGETETEVSEAPSEGIKESDATRIPFLAEAPDGGVFLALFGNMRAQSSAEELKGRHAAAVALLALSPAPLAPQRVSEALWPEDEVEGRNARTRRSRLLAKLREVFGDAVISDGEGWFIERGMVTTDYDQVVAVLNCAPNDHKDAIVAACQQVDAPLRDADQWANEYRQEMVNELLHVLADLKDRAIDADAFDVAKAAKAASTKLGES